MAAPLLLFHNFWRAHPSLLYGLSFAFGIGAALFFEWALLFPVTLLFSPLLLYRAAPAPLLYRTLFALALFVSAYFFAKSTVASPRSESAIVGWGSFQLHSLAKKSKYGRHFFQYKGLLAEFVDEATGQVVAKNLPCIIDFPPKRGEARPPADSSYRVKGELHPAKGYYARLKRVERPWKVIERSFSFAEMRYAAKEALSRYIRSSIQEMRSQLFLSGIATGDFDSEELQYEFSRFGLQHIMAISGFHFALVAAFFNLLFRLFFPYKLSAAFLFFLLCSYFLFLGTTPSILRSFVMIALVIGGTFVEKRGNGLNSLGFSIIAILLFEPTLVAHIGFLFSMLVTAGILLLYPTLEFLSCRLFAKRPYYEVVKMPLIDQHAYCLLTIFRKVLALSATVNCISLPLALYFFKKFPLMGFVYNWFFPFMVSAAIFLLILALLTSFLPLLPAALHAINTRYTTFMLDLVYNMPANFDFYLRTDAVSASLAIVLLTAIFFLSIIARKAVEEELKERSEFAFI